MHDTRNDLPANARASMAAALNARLAGLIDLGLALKHAHWNVKGPHFIGLHELFDEIRSTLDPHADDLAERVTALGGTAQGTLQQVASGSALAPFPAEETDGMILVAELANRVAALGKSVRAGITEAEDAGDAGSADLLTGLSRALDKALWLLEAHLQKR